MPRKSVGACARRLKPTNNSWRVDETYIRVNGKWRYLYRAVDSSGATLDFLLSAKQDAADPFALTLT
jgi:transposase, IS6 family